MGLQLELNMDWKWTGGGLGGVENGMGMEVDSRWDYWRWTGGGIARMGMGLKVD